MDLKDRLKKARKYSGLSQTELAERAGITQASVSEIERGLTRTSSHLIRLAQICGVDPIWLSDGSGFMTSEEIIGRLPMRGKEGPVSYPIISWDVLSKLDYQTHKNSKIETKGSLPGDAFAGDLGIWLEIRDESMLASTSPSFPPGSYILVQPWGFPLISGSYYIFRNSQGHSTFKRYLLDAGKEYMIPLNPSFKPQELVRPEWDVIGRAVDFKMPGIL